ncbi:MAG: metallophosphoesterase family protein [Gemmatimonadaceae bacterium]|nr:metallophosphoesterase family protein [Gemmatimonadaceae bacterium]
MTTQLALLSDVHANLHALDAVLADIAARPGLAGTYHLGDLVGYHAFPNEVTARLRSAGIAGVAGNYDSTVAMHYKHCGCRSENPRQEELAHQSFAWTLDAVTAETRATLAALPFRLDVRPLGGHVAGPTVILLHATPTSNLVYVTEDRSDEFLRKMAQQAGASAGDVIAFGHTHKPWHRLVDDVLFVNTGSVGRPKDGDPRAGWTLLTLGDGAPRAEQVRVDYDIDAACAAVAAAGLPEEFAQSLRTGRA